jgi:hypothetical protein
MLLVMPGRNAAHPRISPMQHAQIVDDRDKPGHDGTIEWHPVFWALSVSAAA